MSTNSIDITADRVLYPTGPGPADVCEWCFQTSPDTAWAVTEQVSLHTDRCTRVCGRCYRARTTGKATPFPSRAELPAFFEQWARWGINGEVDEEFTTRMLAALLPGLRETDAACWLECLQAALLEVQDRNGPGFELISVEPEARDERRLVADSVEKVMECLEALMAGAEPDPLPEHLTARQAAAVYGTDVKTVRWWAAEGDIAAVKVGREWRVPTAELVRAHGEDRVRLALGGGAR
jgi:excisionase family DNA binding protein